MIELKNIKRTYKPKRGTSVKALDNVSLIFGQTGMVFILGKSGSGKSTLLNIIGGLDKYDEGELIIKGKSTKNFNQSDFDSYRNTMIGFIFQEYNILDEFTVAQNIGLALELQGRKATSENISKILKDVDLEGHGTRKPNELSGGQKQRVAIARALVKDPEIIMADEPTGALDSETGKQVFETLKKLSKERLVIVVSHDREFAEKYGSRIVEFKDGIVIRDVTKVTSDKEEESSNITFNDEGFTINEGYLLTKEDLVVINTYLSKNKKEIRVFTHISSDSNGKKQSFVTTDSNKIKLSGDEYKPIKSKLPFKVALKMGASALKHKRVRLFFSILLASIAFALFGLSDTLGSYNKYDTTVKSIKDSEIDYFAFSGEIKKYYNSDNDNYYYENIFLNDEHINYLNSKNNKVKFSGLIGSEGNSKFNYMEQIGESNNEVIYMPYAAGAMQFNDNTLNEYNLSYFGENPTLPINDNEVIITKYIYEVFEKYGYKEDYQSELITISNPSDLIGKTIKIDGELMIIKGIVDTKLDLSRFESLNDVTNTNIGQILLLNELQNLLKYSHHNVFFLSQSKFNELKQIQYIYNGYFQHENAYIDNLIKIDSEKNIIYFNGVNSDELTKNDVLVSSQLLNSLKLYDKDIVDDESFNLTLMYISYNQTGVNEMPINFRIVGTFDANDYMHSIAVSEEFAKELNFSENGVYSAGIASIVDIDSKTIREFAVLHFEDNDIAYRMRNAVMSTLDQINSFVETLSVVFLYIGIGFAVFASLLLLNFITASVSYKKQEIGILRAIGARGKDVLSIFSKEALIISLINYVISMTIVIFATNALNNSLRKDYDLLITILNLGIRQFIVVLLVSVLVAYISSALPVLKIARKRPIDAIRDR